MHMCGCLHCRDKLTKLSYLNANKMGSLVNKTKLSELLNDYFSTDVIIMISWVKSDNEALVPQMSWLMFASVIETDVYDYHGTYFFCKHIIFDEVNGCISYF